MVRFVRTPIFQVLGRRGLLLLMFGLLWMCFGASIILVDLPPRFSDKYFPILSVMDGPWTGILWTLFGATAVITAFVRTRMGGKDSIGFNALITPPFVWVLGYVWSAALWLITGEFGKESGWVSLIVWLIVCTFVMLVADWPDPDDPIIRKNQENNDGTDQK